MFCTTAKSQFEVVADVNFTSYNRGHDTMLKFELRSKADATFQKRRKPLAIEMTVRLVQS